MKVHWFEVAVAAIVTGAGCAAITRPLRERMWRAAGERQTSAEETGERSCGQGKGFGSASCGDGEFKLCAAPAPGRWSGVWWRILHSATWRQASA